MRIRERVNAKWHRTAGDAVQLHDRQKRSHPKKNTDSCIPLYPTIPSLTTRNVHVQTDCDNKSNVQVQQRGMPITVADGSVPACKPGADVVSLYLYIYFLVFLLSSSME